MCCNFYLKYLLPLICSANLLVAQNVSPEVMSSAGGTAQGNNIQIDWTLGEIAITAIANDELQITQGFHQPYYTITNLNEIPEHIGSIEVFPNPSSDWIQMTFNFEQFRQVQIQLFDVQGKMIWQEQKNGHQFTEKKDLRELPNGNYFLKFSLNASSIIQTFKIQKIN